MLEVVETGIRDPELSICALAELLEQLYSQEREKVLVCVDEYNWLFRPSVYRSFRYANDKGLKG